MRRVGLALGVFVAAVAVGYRFIVAQPLEEWFLPRLLIAAFCTALWTAACWLSGERILEWLLPGRELDGRAVHGFAIGVLLFSLLIFVAGALGLWGPACFVLLPAALLLCGRPRRIAERLERLHGELRGSPFELVAVAAGAVALAMLWVIALPEDNLSFDARWYHVGLAEQYVAGGGVVRFPEARAQATVSHLATWLYAWAFQLPWGELRDRILLARQIELVMIAFTLLGLPALARALAPSAGRQRLAWLCFFLFPSIFVYDTAPLGAADHVCAFWTVPLWLALIELYRAWDVRTAVLFAVAASGLLATKYPAMALLLPACVGLAASAARRAYQQPAQRGATVRSLLAIPAAMLLFTAPHWLKNWLFYGSPLYPALCDVLSCSPWTRDSPAWLARYLSESVDVSGSPVRTALGAARALVDFSYGPYTWPDFHGTIPAFGSLFTACWLLWPWLRTGARLWAAIACLHVAILIWYVTAHQERYLLPLVPLMAAVVSATLALAFQQGSRVVRAGVALLVLVQLVGAASLPFLPTHRGHQESPLGRGVRFLGLLTDNERGAHSSSFHVWSAVGRALPQDAIALLHRAFLHLGIGRRVVSDAVPHQFGLDYAALGSLPAIHRQLREFGVTDLIWKDGTEDQDSLAGELLFRAYAALATEAPRTVAGWTLATMKAAPPNDPGSRVVKVQCDASPAAQLFSVADLSAPLPPLGDKQRVPAPRRAAAQPEMLLAEADYLVVCGHCVSTKQLAPFTPLGRRGTCDVLFVRRPATQPAAP